jgi:hypothetical protein
MNTSTKQLIIDQLLKYQVLPMHIVTQLQKSGLLKGLPPDARTSWYWDQDLMRYYSEEALETVLTTIQAEVGEGDPAEPLKSAA